MKPRHAAALALVGWYLMTPPVSKDGDTVMVGGRPFDVSAPISEWHFQGSFDSAVACGTAQNSAESFKVPPGVDPKEQKWLAKNLQSIFALGRCIATDDPRLKPN
jgi:hypothetical protein